MKVSTLQPGKETTNSLEKRHTPGRRGVLEQFTTRPAHFIIFGFKAAMRTFSDCFSHNIHLLKILPGNRQAKIKNTNLILTLTTFYIFVKTGRMSI